MLFLAFSYGLQMVHYKELLHCAQILKPLPSAFTEWLNGHLIFVLKEAAGNPSRRGSENWFGNVVFETSYVEDSTSLIHSSWV